MMRRIMQRIFSSIAYSGINGTTAHSRANCGNNESITWWLGHAYDWRVVSIHMEIMVIVGTEQFNFLRKKELAPVNLKNITLN